MTKIDQKIKSPLVDALENYLEEDVLSFDVPGHKKRGKLSRLATFFGERILALDANSMPQLDNLSNPTGVLKEAEALVAALFMADRAHFLVNGTTVGIQAMIMTLCRPGDKLIVPRNVHKSVINAIILAGVEPIYVYPEIDERLGIATAVTFEAIVAAVEGHREATALLLINPTYYGVCSELERIVEYAHEQGLAVLVDEAHGAHLLFSEELPLCAMEAGADISTVSLHKTGGSLTQSSVLLAKSERVDAHRLKSVLNLLQTTSASYLLMASLDAARCELAANGEQLVRESLQLARYARERLSGIEGLDLPGRDWVHDETKLMIHTSGIGLTGFEFYDLLRHEYKVQLELADPCNVLALITIGDIQKSVECLCEAIEDLAKNHRKEPFRVPLPVLKTPPLVITPRDAFHARKHTVALDEAIGEISGESVTLYPPGIPIVMPGERITQEVVDYIKLLKQENGLLVDLADATAETLDVLGQE